MANIKESVNLREEKMFPKMWAKRGFKMMRKLCSIAAVTSKVGKIHLSVMGKLIGFSSQIKAPPAVQKGLTNAAAIEESSFKYFMQNQIESNNFNNETIKKNKLRNSDAAIIAKIMEIHGKDIAIKNIEKCPPDYW